MPYIIEVSPMKDWVNTKKQSEISLELLKSILIMLMPISIAVAAMIVWVSLILLSLTTQLHLSLI